MTRFRTIMYTVLAALLVAAPASTQNFPGASGNPSILSRPGGGFYAPAFNWQARVISGNSATGTATIIVAGNASSGVTLPDGTSVSWNTIFFTLNPIIVDWGQAAQETVTPTAVSIGGCPAGNLGVGSGTQCASITGTFANTHGQSAIVMDGAYGLQTALNYAFATTGGGLVSIDPAWSQMGGTNAMISAAIPVANTSIADYRSGTPRFWNLTPTGAALAVPTTLTAQLACDATHQTCSDATVVGSASWGGAIHACVAYVDIAGNEGPCSLDATWTSAASKAIDVAAPAASAGAVGFVVYLSLSGGTYAQAYAMPITSSVCTLTTLETVTPACAVANATYGQAASTFGAGGLFTKGGAQFGGTTFPVNTSQHFTKLGSVAMTAASLTPITNSSVSYAYVPGSRVGICPGMSSANVVNYAAAPSSATTIPNAVATWTIPANCFNYVGAEFRVSGKFTFTDGGDSSTEVRVAWDAPLSNATTVPTTLCSMVDTATGTGAAYNATYTCTIRVATTGATGTALVNGYATMNLAAGATTLVRNSADVAVAPSAATVNLTAPARIVVYFIGTGATNNPGAQGLAATLETIN